MRPSLPLRLAILLLALLVVGLAIGSAWAWSELSTPYAGWRGVEVVVDLPRGQDAGTMLSRLGEAGVLESPGLARLWLVFRGGADALHAGEYRFDHPVTPLEVLRRLRTGEVLLHAVTVPEGLVLEEIAARFVETGLAEYEPLMAAFREPAPIQDLDPDAADLEGYLFPDTYHFPRGESPENIVRTMVGRLREVLGEDYAGAAAGVGLSGVAQAVTLASLIEEETSVPDERGKISRVFHNRLQRGMKLQCDPTVLYSLHRAEQPVERLLIHHLDFESPWNTYLNEGLPPGPICNPGRESVEAAVRPAPGDELYFVAAPEGGHRFSKHLAAHQKAVREWRRYLRSSR